MLNAPTPLLGTEREAPDCWLRTVMAAPGMTAPAESETVPSIKPVCAPHSTAPANRSRPLPRTILSRCISPPGMNRQAGKRRSRSRRGSTAASVDAPGGVETSIPNSQPSPSHLNFNFLDQPFTAPSGLSLECLASECWYERLDCPRMDSWNERDSGSNSPKVISIPTRRGYPQKAVDSRLPDWGGEGLGIGVRI